MPQLSPTMGFLFALLFLTAILVIFINLKSNKFMESTSSYKSFNEKYF